MARRIRTGEWLTKNLYLDTVERNAVLSGPSTLTGNLEPGFAQQKHTDGLRVIEERATMIYAVNDATGQIETAGIVTAPTAYEDRTRITCAGVTSYPKGYIYTGSRLWGPAAAVPARSGTPAQAALPRPDAVEVYVDHWNWMQAQPASDLGVVLTGDLTTRNAQGVSRVPIGTMAEPYRLRRWDAPDLGSKMSELAEATPFDFVERTRWADADREQVVHEVQIGYPRLGRRRDDLRFAQGENIDQQPAISTLEQQANHIIGLGNGEAGPSMAFRDTPWDDGTLRSTRVFTDKTLGQAMLDRRVAILQRIYEVADFDVTSVVVVDHPNAPLSAIQLGDDIRVLGTHQEFGRYDLWVRVLAIGRSEQTDRATLTTSRSDLFIYNPTEEIA